MLIHPIIIKLLSIMGVLYPDRIEIWSVGFCGGRKTGEPGEKPSEQGREPTTNSVNPQVTPSPGIESGHHRWEARALITAPSLLPSTILPK